MPELNIHESFPRYTEHKPLVPVWNLTHGIPGCIHRFFDSSSISPSGRYVAVFQLPFEDRRPEPGEEGHVWLIDLYSGQRKKLAGSRGWEPQLGANINWGATDEELYFNDVDVSDWSPFVVQINPLTGKKKRINGSVYQVSPDGRYIVSSDLTLLRRTQCGYGLRVPEDKLNFAAGRRSDTGVFLIDLKTNGRRMLASIEELTECLILNGDTRDLENAEIYAFHTSFNRQSDKVLVQVRWAPAGDEESWPNDEIPYPRISRSFVAIDLDGGEISCVLPPEIEARGCHHAAWMPDGQNVSLNLKLDGRNMRFCSVSWDGSNLRELFQNVRGSGHPSGHPSGSVVTDTYLKAWDFPQYGDGTVPIRWLQAHTGSEYVPIRINATPPSTDPVLRVDPHPAWCRDFRHIVINGVCDGTRVVFFADMGRMIQAIDLPATEQRFEVENNLGGLARFRRLLKKIRRRCCDLLKS